MEKKTEDAQSSSDASQGTWTGWGWNMVESVGKTITSMAGYDDLEVVNPEGEQTANANGIAGWKDLTSDRRNMSEEAQSFWTQISKFIGSDVTSLMSVPIFIMEPTSVLQKMAEIMEYPQLLDKAATSDEAAERMAWAAAFAVSVYASAERTWKPFNPVLGETFQLKIGEDGEYLAEQVSHHPPIGAAHAESPLWEYDIVSCPKTKFLGNSLEVYPVGRTRIKLKTTNETITLVPPTSKAYNLVIGKIWVDTFGEMVLQNIDSGWKCVLNFVPCGFFGSSRYLVKGNVFNDKDEPVLYLEGKWNSHMKFKQCNSNGDPLPDAEWVDMWNASQKPAGDAYGFTKFVHEHLNKEPGMKVLASDSRFRPDRAALQEGDSSEAGKFKHKVEEMQRAEKKERTSKNDVWTPRWFKQIDNPKLYDREYSLDDCPFWEFSGFPESDKLVEVGADYLSKAEDIYNPWQYPDLHTKK